MEATCSFGMSVSTFNGQHGVIHVSHKITAVRVSNPTGFRSLSSLGLFRDQKPASKGLIMSVMFP
jgi:hypothetical protein